MNGSKTSGSTTAQARSERVRLIESLVTDLAPVRPVRFSRILTACLMIELAVVASVVWLIGVRPDLTAQLSKPLFSVAILMLGTTAVACAVAAIRMAIPGREPRAHTVWPLITVPAVLAVITIVVASFGGSWTSVSDAVMGCRSCFGVMVAGAAAPWVVTLVFVGRLAAVRELRAAVFGGFSAFLLGALVTNLHCSNSNLYHVALVHYLPIAVFASFAAVAAAIVFRTLRLMQRSTGS